MARRAPNALSALVDLQPHFDFAKRFGVEVDMRNLDNPERPSVEILTFKFKVATYEVAIEIPTEEIETFVGEFAKAHGQKPPKKDKLPKELFERSQAMRPIMFLDDEFKSEIFPISSLYIGVINRSGVKLDADGDVIQAPLKDWGQKEQNWVVIWDYSRDGRRRTGRAVPMDMDGAKNAGILGTPPDRLHPTTGKVAFFPNVRRWRQRVRDGKGFRFENHISTSVEARHHTGKRMIWDDRFPRPQYGLEVLVAMFENVSNILCVPAEEIKSEASVQKAEAAGSALVVFDKENVLAEDEVIFDGQVINVWAAAQPFGLLKDMGEREYKKRKHELTKQHHPDMLAKIPANLAALATAKRRAGLLLQALWEKIETLSAARWAKEADERRAQKAAEKAKAGGEGGTTTGEGSSGGSAGGTDPVQASPAGA